MSSLENYMVISYYFHYPVQAGEYGIKFVGETDLKLPKKISVVKMIPFAPTSLTWLRAYVPLCLKLLRAYVPKSLLLLRA